MLTLVERMRRLLRRAARYLFPDEVQDYAPVRATWRSPPRSILSRKLSSHDGSDARHRKRVRLSPDEGLQLRRQAYVARLWADDTKDFKIE